MFEKYYSYLIRSMLINNDRFINCPGKNCENVIKILNEDLMKNVYNPRNIDKFFWDKSDELDKLLRDTK